MGGSAMINGNLEYEEFDNFNMDFPFIFEGKEWKSVEQLYQSMKFQNENYKEEIRLETNPQQIYMMGQNRNEELKEPLTDMLRLNNMYVSMKARITHHPSLQKLLLDTGELDITFPDSDKFWGTRGGYGGENWNGKLLKRIRQELKK